jgi:hypothetical protein
MGIRGTGKSVLFGSLLVISSLHAQIDHPVVPGPTSNCQAEVLETDNFRFHTKAPIQRSQELAEECETWRRHVIDRLTLGTHVQEWRPKCEVHLFDQPAEFARQSGLPQGALAAAQLEIGDGQVWQRRINARADDATVITRLLRHEIVHVVLADRFPHRRIPGWADEGLAVLFESPERLENLKDVHRRHSSLLEQPRFIRSLSGNPLITRTRLEADVYYARAAMLSRYLIRRDTPERFLHFLEHLQSQGIESALRSHYGLDRLPSLEELSENAESLAWSITQTEHASKP